jgi:nitrogen fixation NifU-like protein
VARFPARVKCALLSWMAWKDATSQIVGGADTLQGEPVGTATEETR